jgi:hypothetical protein
MHKIPFCLHLIRLVKGERDQTTLSIFLAHSNKTEKKKKKKKRFAHVAADGRVRVFECDNGEMLTEMHHKNNLKHKPTSVAFAPAPAAQVDVRGSKKKKKKKKIVTSSSTSSIASPIVLEKTQAKRRRGSKFADCSWLCVGRCAAL